MSYQGYKIDSKIFIRGQLELKTGMHIGGNSVGMAIGGADSVVVRNPLNNEPYIPGSSLRGKMRALLERMRGLESENSEGGFNQNGDVGQNADTLLGKLFGVAVGNDDNQAHEPTRLMVRDAGMNYESVQQLETVADTDMPLTEVKTEVTINRVTAAATPREFERVPAGARFDFELVLTVLEKDQSNKDDLLRLVSEGLSLVEEDSLGGQGSRGYGQVQVFVNEVSEKTAQAYRDLQSASPLETSRFQAFQSCSESVQE